MCGEELYEDAGIEESIRAGKVGGQAMVAILQAAVRRGELGPAPIPYRIAAYRSTSPVTKYL